MTQALVGWLLVLLSMVGGFLIGRYRRYTRPAPPPRSARAASAPRVRPAARSTRTVSVPVSTAALPADLPSDTDGRRPDSVPKRLQ